MWVSETLTGAVVDPGQLVYADLIDTITTALQLDRWTSFIENAIHDRVSDAALQAQAMLGHRMLATIWPGTLADLETSIQFLVDAYSDYVFHFFSNSEPLRDRWYGPDHSYRRVGHPDYQRLREEEEHWSQVNYALLSRLTIRLNDFADKVRLYFNPLYFRVRGRFVIVDSLGTWHDGVGTYSLPNGEDVDRRLTELGWKPGETYQD